MINGVVYKIRNGIYLSLYNPDDESVTDGIPITEGPYKTLQNNQVSVVEMILKDGTQEIVDINISDFVYNRAERDAWSIFYNIKDLMIYTIENFTIEDIYENGDFIGVVKDMIKNIKENN